MNKVSMTVLKLLLIFPTAFTSSQASAADEQQVRPVDQALFDAIDEGSVSRLRAAMARGANANAIVNSSSALEMAVSKKSLEMVKLLIETYRANPNPQTNRTPLSESIDAYGFSLNNFGAPAEFSAAITNYLLSHGADVNYAGTEAATSNGQRLPLHRAALAGRDEVYRSLIAAGANATSSQPNAGELFERALRGNSKFIVDDLMSKGFLAPAIAKLGRTEILRLSASNGDKSIYDAVVKAIEKSDGKPIGPEIINDVGADRCNRSVLKTAALSNNLEIVQDLLRRGAVADLRFGNGQNALFGAHRPEIARALIAAGASAGIGGGGPTEETRSHPGDCEEVYYTPLESNLYFSFVPETENYQTAEVLIQAPSFNACALEFSRVSAIWFSLRSASEAASRDDKLRIEKILKKIGPGKSEDDYVAQCGSLEHPATRASQGVPSNSSRPRVPGMKAQGSAR